MLQAGAGLSRESNPERAVREACATAMAEAACERPVGALLFATAAHAAAMPSMVAEAERVLGVAPVGASSQGVLVGGDAQEGGAGVSVLALSGWDPEPFLLADVAGREASAGERFAHYLEAPLRREDLVVLFPDGLAVSPEALLGSLVPACGDALVVGAGAFEGPCWAEGETAEGAVAGMILRGGAGFRAGVTQACQPVTDAMTVTRADGHWILELDGRPALDVFTEAARGPLAEDLRRASAFVLLAWPEGEDADAALRAGHYRVRNVVGFDPEARRGIASPEPVRAGDRAALVLREPHGAREDLKRMLKALAGPADFGLYLDCCARGAALFGVPGLEAAYLEERFGKLPLVGMHGAYEIGPVCGATELLTYTGVLALAGR